MTKDPILEEIRQIRLAIETECQNYRQILGDYILRNQQKYGERLVRRNPKPAILPSKSKQISGG